MNSVFINHIDLALKQAQIAFDCDEVPVGAVIAHYQTKEVIAQSYNKVKTLNNPIAHAELNVIQEACQKLKVSRLDDYDLYCTLEPCVMCASAIAKARIKRLYFAASDSKYGGVVSNLKYFSTNACHHKVEYYYGMKEMEAKKLLKDFFAQKR